MKKICILIWIIGGILAQVHAQRTTTASNFKGGVRAGFTASQISGDNLTGFHKLGAYAGLYACYPLTEKGNLKLQAEIDFTIEIEGQRKPALEGIATFLYYFK